MGGKYDRDLPNPIASVPPRWEASFRDLPLAPKAMKKGTSVPSWLTVSSAGRFVRGLTSLPESNRSVGSLNRLLSVLSARSASPLTLEARLAESSDDSESIFRSRDGEAPREKEAEGSASEAADVETKRFG